MGKTKLTHCEQLDNKLNLEANFDFLSSFVLFVESQTKEKNRKLIQSYLASSNDLKEKGGLETYVIMYCNHIVMLRILQAELLKRRDYDINILKLLYF